MIGRYLTGEPVTRKWVDLDEMSEALPRPWSPPRMPNSASITASTGTRSTIIEDAQDGEVARGGSTITQQVAKNLFLWPGRSVIRKALEFHWRCGSICAVEKAYSGALSQCR
jgi:monofunctional biosynthetic peptidoglycan transglycosylase